MTDTTKQLAEALRLAKEYADDEDWSRVKGCINLALAAHDAEQAQEPVAWGQLGLLNGRSYLREKYDRTPYPPPPDVVRNLNLVPLYAAHESAAESARLTDEQRIDWLCEEAVYHCGQWQVVFDSDKDSFIDAIDEVAAIAHGIGATTGGQQR